MEKTKISQKPWLKVLVCGARLEGNLGLHEILNELSHMDILNQQSVEGFSKEIAHVSNATAFLLQGTDGMVALL